MQNNIIVTGATRGIGAAMAAQLEAQGARVFRTGSNNFDLSDPESPDELWSAALAAMDGRVDVLINNAALFAENPLDNPHWLAAWERTMMINLTAAAQLSRLAVQHWLAQGATGRIVNIASRAAHRGDSPDHWHYAASKGGMVALTKTIARGYAKQGILAFAICPGFTMTEMVADYLAEQGGGAGLLADIPLGRAAMPQEIADIAVFCALQAPPAMTGAVLDANGASYVR